MSKVVTFGEVMMRLSPPENRRVRQSHQLEIFFGGTELNVASSLANFEMQVEQVSVVSNDFIGESAIAAMRHLGVGVAAVTKVDYPLGLYFLENGAGMRPSQISYNRLNAAFANIDPESINWVEILDGCTYLHWTGITPGISESAYKTLKDGLEIAQNKEITVTTDPSYRSNLWKYGKNGQEVLAELTGFSNIFIGGANEINEILKTDFENNPDGFIEASKELIVTFPSIKKVFNKVRTSFSASWQKIYGQAWTGTEYITTDELEISNVIDRIGTGDAFAAGIIYGLEHYDSQKTLEFANASCALKHTILGDNSLVCLEEILDVMQGSRNGRIKR
ncbi:sugar kinase [Salegentibacter maritimus]|uniref:Sugar kinase n=1 Tax=Salegentibacter maritimus TaxID=2794347 RepID=A0ABS0TJK1_9FLAO|nr:sugar kinase [Salegentibacter maritimus]MBI6121244.1 sugar kinase [Salegentibacter maritimus]